MGSHNGHFVRKSAKTRSWEKAEDYRRKLEDSSEHPTSPASNPPTVTAVGPHASKKTDRVTIEAAVDAYLQDAKSRELEVSTLSKLETIFRKQFISWTKSEGYKFLDEIDLDSLMSFRSTWSDGPLAKRKKQERLIGFFWMCVRRGYIRDNPTFGLGKIKADQAPTDYFPADEFDRIIDAAYAYRENRGETGNTNGTRLCTLTLVMRWSGLRIRDAVTLERSRLHSDSLLLHQAKTASAYVARHMRGGNAARRRANRSSFDSARSCKRENYREALLSLGQSSSASTSTQRPQCVASRNSEARHQCEQSQTA